MVVLLLLCLCVCVIDTHTHVRHNDVVTGERVRHTVVTTGHQHTYGTVANRSSSSLAAFAADYGYGGSFWGASRYPSSIERGK